MNAKEFALQQIAPYYKDPSTCGYDKETGNCENITKDGKMCVAGKNLLKNVRDLYPNKNISSILYNCYDSQSNVFIPSSVDILSNEEWESLQCLHDAIANSKDSTEVLIVHHIGSLNLFTLEELKEYSSKLK